MALIGHVRGGLGYVAILASCVMASLSGSAVADAAALGALLVPMMVRAGHDKARSAGLIARHRGRRGPAALGPDAPVAHVEDLHRRFELVGVESDDVVVSVLP